MRTLRRKIKKIWLFLSRIKDHVSEDIVKKYIQEKLKNDLLEPSVRKLKTFYMRKDNNCFLVGVDFSLKEAIYEHSFWPKGVTFERFDFRRGQHFLDNHQESVGIDNTAFTVDNSDFLSL